jgi:hypothetical protein
MISLPLRKARCQPRDEHLFLFFQPEPTKFFWEMFLAATMEAV